MLENRDVGGQGLGFPRKEAKITGRGHRETLKEEVVLEHGTLIEPLAAGKSSKAGTTFVFWKHASFSSMEAPRLRATSRPPVPNTASGASPLRVKGVNLL